MKKKYELKMDWVKSEKIDKVGVVTLNHENSLNPLSSGFVKRFINHVKLLMRIKKLIVIILM